ncbi:MAG: cytosolic protein [Dehalococcoidia bacterium]|nr:cytosolic protein [Dehalococcoidia bacterium]
MKKIDVAEVTAYVERNIGGFHSKRLQRMQKLRLTDVLRRKNPYLFKAKNILIAHDLVKTLLDAYLSSQEETIFGDFLEGLAIFISRQACGGNKSSAEGIDLEFDRGRKRYIVAMKSGPNWGNSSQIRKMREDFTKAKRVLRTSGVRLEVVAVNGCCYGRNNSPDKGDHFKYCGQEFWEFISGSRDLYVDLIVPLGHRAKEKNERFLKEYAKIVNTFTEEFSKRFCAGGEIDWEALVRFNSAISRSRKK